MEGRFRAMIGRDDGWFARRGIAAEPALKQESCRERESHVRKCNRAMWGKCDFPEQGDGHARAGKGAFRQAEQRDNSLAASRGP